MLYFFSGNQRLLTFNVVELAHQLLAANHDRNDTAHQRHGANDQKYLAAFFKGELHDVFCASYEIGKHTYQRA